MIKAQHKATGELSLIDHIRRNFPERNRFIALGIGDDCAILRPRRGHEIVVTTDFSLESRHFRRDLHPPASVGHRCLARGLSDLAAMGGTPLAAFLSLAIPAPLLKTKGGRSWLDGFISGFRSLAVLHQTPLAGGDTSESPADLILADIVLVGTTPQGRALRRSTAQAGDSIYVTGSLGGAHAELSALLTSPPLLARASAKGDHPHFFPQPRLAVGSALLRRRLATGAIDLSDGLSTDLTHLCESSGLRAEIDAAAIPLHTLARKLPPSEAISAALNGGEDYELLFTAPPSTRIPHRIAGVQITCIGTMYKTSSRKPRITLIQPDGENTELKAGGWEHLSGR